MLTPSFNKSIKGIIKKLNFPVYVVIPNKEYICTCRDANNQPDPACPKCLGTGYRIKIRKLLAAMEPEDENGRVTNSGKRVMNSYYFDADTTPRDAVKLDNIVVRDDEVDILMYPKLYRSDSNKVIYYYCPSAEKRTHKDVFLENFWKLVGGR